MSEIKQNPIVIELKELIVKANESLTIIEKDLLDIEEEMKIVIRKVRNNLRKE